MQNTLEHKKLFLLGCGCNQRSAQVCREFICGMSHVDLFDVTQVNIALSAKHLQQDVLVRRNITHYVMRSLLEKMQLLSAANQKTSLTVKRWES